LKSEKKSKNVEVICVFSGEEELEALLMRSFSHFISREVARGQAHAV